MASCLYECLSEAELEKYYPHFIALGFQKIDELAKVSMKDYAKLGVHNMKDRKRLFQLIRLIKILQAEEEAVERNKQHFQARGLHFQPRVTRSGPRRQLHFESLSVEKDGGSNLEAGLCALSTCSVTENKDDLAAVWGHDSEYKQPRRDTATWTEFKLDIPAISSSSDVDPLLGDAETPIVQRVAHISGYNYGVPHSCSRPNASEKETPWTEMDKIRVCVRKRPLGLREGRRGEVNIITVEDKETLLLHEKKEAVDLTQYILQHVFYFDEVFGEACSNRDVYMKTAHPLIQHIFNGGNATCFAYGQTGAGKTYTMIGTHQNPGLYALAAKDIFRQLETSATRKDLHVWISFYEIYCGQLYDLLNGRKRLFAREDSKHVVQIVGLREVQVDTVGLLLEVILKGGKERSTGATGVNSDSSRSHAIIQIQIKDPANRVFGRISFIDLAGSERAADARDSDRQTKMEGAEINQSLLALKECIRALDQEQAHTPFRQSKLTQVLKDSFVGNSKTCMIANVSPSHIATEHTLNTLRYADRVKELKKGMRCGLPPARRRSAPGSLSPKRVQSSPGVQVGEKNSPKKVKLGVHHPPTPAAAARTKAPPLLSPSGHSPCSSTPKAPARKGHPAAPLLSLPSPVKGALRAGPPARKMVEEPLLPSARSLLGKDCEAGTASPAEAGREAGQGDRQQARGLRVQPVRKQLVSRGDLPFRDADRPSAQAEAGRRRLAEQCTEAWTSLPPHPRDREQHLRLYHQQFQQPPILHQKLDYQPLEQFLVRYKPQEVCVMREPRCAPPPSVSPPGQDETLHLEDLEDSDFSEDSFSPGPGRGRPEPDAPGERSQGSFFLHQRECWPADQGGRELVFNPHVPVPQSGALQSPGKAAGCEEAETSPAGWSTEEAAALQALPRNTVPEKPFCSQGHRGAGHQTSAHQCLLGQKHPVSANLCLACSDEHCLLPEKAPPSPPSAPILAPARCAGRDQREELVKGKHAPRPEHVGKKNQQAGEELCEALAPSLGFVTGVLGAETPAVPKEDPSCQGQGKAREEKEMQEKQSWSPGNQWNEEATQSPGGGGHEADQCRKQAVRALPLPAAASSPSCRSPKALNSLGGASSLRGGQDCLCGLSPGDAVLEGPFSVFGESESALRLGDLEVSEGGAGPHHDDDTEATGIASLSCSGQFSLGEDDNTKLMAQLKPAGLLEKFLVSSASPVSDGSANSECSGESFPLQLGLEFGTLELGHAQEAFKFTFSSEDIGLLKNTCLPRALTHNSSDAAKQTAQVLGREMNPSSSTNSLTAYGQLEPARVSLPCKETLGRQFVLQIRQEQLNEMAALCLQEESLISRTSDGDFEGLVVKLDEMLMLKSKCIQKMRTQLQPLLATPTGLALQGLPPTLL